MPIRLFGDPVLRSGGQPVTDFGPGLRRLADDMFETMDAANGAGLAAPQVGVLLRMFVYDIDDTGPQVVCNPEFSGFEGSWAYEEGCLSLPGIYVEVERPDVVTCRFQDVDGNAREVHADQLLGRVFQHEADHCDGVFFLERAEKSARKEAMREFRRRFSGAGMMYVPERDPLHDRSEHAL